MKANKIKIWIEVLVFLAALTIIALHVSSCSKQEYPKQVLNIKATDCTYTINGNSIRFTYVSNEAGNESYKRKALTGYCNTWNIKEYNESYLWIDTAMIVSQGVFYGE